MDEDLNKEISLEGYIDGYSQCLVNIEIMLKNKTRMDENILQRMIKRLEAARDEYVAANK